MGVRSIDKVQHTKERLVIFKENRVGGRARVTIDEDERVYCDNVEQMEDCSTLFCRVYAKLWHNAYCCSCS